MSGQRLAWGEIAKLIEGWPDEPRELALELRDLVLEAGPELAEKVAFNALCYYKPGRAYGVIGGNVCMIAPRDDCLHLGFIHGATLPDPECLLRGKGKAKRHIELRGPTDIRRGAFKKLIREAIAYDPATV